MKRGFIPEEERKKKLVHFPGFFLLRGVSVGNSTPLFPSGCDSRRYLSTRSILESSSLARFVDRSEMLTINNALLMLDKKLQEENKFNEYLTKVEASTGIERRKIVLGSSFFLGAMVIIGYGAQLICNGVGFAYPAYASILAIESRNKEDDTVWLTYWVVFAALCLVEFFSDFILALIPFYWMLKCVFLIWCFMPCRLNGSKFLYYKFIRPTFLSHLGSAESEDNSPGEEHEKSS